MNEKNIVSLAIIIIFLSVKYLFVGDKDMFIPAIENMAGSENVAASDCQQSINDFNAALQVQQKQDQDNYNADLTAWNAQKNAFQTAFATNPVKWRQYCQGGACPPETFFRKIPQTDIGGYDLPGNTHQTDVTGCLQMCLDRDDCLWCQYSNGNCWLKGNVNNDQNWTHYFKTDTGWKTVDNLYIGGYDIPGGNDQHVGYPPNFDIANSMGADNISTRKSDQVSWYKRFNLNRWGGDTYIKNTQATYVFPDSSPVILNNVGPKPVIHHTPVELSVVCQDCRQSLGSNQVTDSKQVNMSQFNQCVANLQKNIPPPTPPSNTMPSSTPSTPVNTESETPTTTTTNTTTPTTPTTSENSSIFANKGFLIGGGVSLTLTIIAIIVIVVIFTRRK